MKNIFTKNNFKNLGTIIFSKLNNIKIFISKRKTLSITIVSIIVLSLLATAIINSSLTEPQCYKDIKSIEPVSNNEFLYDSSQAQSSVSEGYPYNTTDAITNNNVMKDNCVVESDIIPAKSFVENDFIFTKEESISTFSSDVDTASYITFRQFVNNNYNLLSSTNNFRTEEFLNYFKYNYVSPKTGEMFGVTTEVGICPWNANNSLVRIGIKASENTKKENKPLNLVFLIDSSGSMCDEEKLPLLQKSLTAMLSKLDKNDTISIVTYSGSSQIILNGARGNQTAKITKALNSIVASGGTNGGAGLEMAYKTAKKHFSNSKNNRIMLCTDGDLNLGMTSTEEIKDYVSKQKASGIYLSVLGFGNTNYNDSILETIADNGNGTYSIIDTLKQGKKVLLDEFAGTINTVATDVKFQVKFDSDKIDSYRLIGYENRALNNEDFNNDQKDAGDVGAGHTITILYEINSNSALTENAMALNIRYKNNYTDKSIKQTHMIDCTPTQQPSEDFIFASAVSELVMILNNSKYLNNGSINDVITMLNTINTKDADKIEFSTLVKKLTTQTSTTTYPTNEPEYYDIYNPISIN